VRYDNLKKLIGHRSRRRPPLSDQIAPAAKARGIKLGGTNAKSLAFQTEAAERAEALRSVMDELSGLSARAAADELNKHMVATPKGGKWHASSVLLVRERLAAG
jgi:hypothetical protein